MKQCLAGHKVTRTGWKTSGQYVTYVMGEGSTKGYLAWHTASGKQWPATLGQRDLLGTDWKLA